MSDHLVQAVVGLRGDQMTPLHQKGKHTQGAGDTKPTTTGKAPGVKII